MLECFNGEILALAMDDNMKKELCVKTIEQMKEQYGKQLKGMIFTVTEAVNIPAKRSKRHLNPVE